MEHRIINIDHQLQRTSDMRYVIEDTKTLQYLMGHSNIGVTMNTDAHLGLEDSQNEMRRIEGMKQLKAKVDRPVTRKMFKAV